MIRDIGNFDHREQVQDPVQLFTDRHELIHRFSEYLHDDPAPNTILYFHGSGGNGKTWLLRMLQNGYCKRIQSHQWQKLKARPDGSQSEQVAQHIQNATDVTKIPAVLLDFSQRQIHKENPRCPFYGLLMLRRKLGESARKLNYHWQFPQYDFGCFWYLYQHGESGEEIRRLFATETASLIAGIVDLFLPGVGSVAKGVLELKDRLFPDQRRHQIADILNLPQDKIQPILNLDPDSNLIDELPKLFAQDLKAIMGHKNAPPRIVLFFDAHDRVWGQQATVLRGEPYFQQDEWLRRLFTELLTSNDGIVSVVSGQELPRWHEATQFPIASAALDPQLVGHLSPNHAYTYLQRQRITDPSICEEIVNYAKVSPNQVHPFYLGFCADIVRAYDHPVAGTFEPNLPETDKVRYLRERLLANVNEEICCAVQALSACRGFNRNIYFYLGQQIHFHATDASFRYLTRLSFVWRDDRFGKDWYRIHNLLRRLENESNNEITRSAHRCLEQYYHDQNDAAAEIYHAIHCNSQHGINKYVEYLGGINLKNRSYIQAFLDAVSIDVHQEPKRFNLALDNGDE